MDDFAAQGARPGGAAAGAAGTGERTGLRLDLWHREIHVTPGEPTLVTVEVLNTSTVIETIDVRVLGLMAEEEWATPNAPPALFPGESTFITIELIFHETLPAGTHEAIVVASGSSGLVEPAESTVTFHVPKIAAALVSGEPPLREGGRKAAFELLFENTGNTPLSLRTHATDADRVLAIVLDTTTVNLPVGGLDAVHLEVRGRRPWFGAPVEHVVTVDVEGDGVQDATQVRFRQKPRLTAGVITILTLSLVVALWALAMLFGVERALAAPKPTKELATSFSTGISLEQLDVAEVGGTLAGQVRAATTGRPLARVTVEAFDHRGRPVAATATDDDGKFELGSLLPAKHRLRIRAEGFDPVWYPGVPAWPGAQTIVVSSTTPTEVDDVLLTGRPATLGGRALLGDSPGGAIRVEVSTEDLLDGQTVFRTTVTDADGLWSISGLPSPAVYLITYRADGYAAVEVSQPVTAGVEVVVNPKRLPAADGGLVGLVLDPDGEPLGGVEVVAKLNETEVATTTPTSGAVGTFEFVDLATPATYLVTFTAEGYATETRAYELQPGQIVGSIVEPAVVTLSSATGVVGGLVTVGEGAAATGLGGVTVSVAGGGVVLSTETLSDRSTGRYRLSGLPVPATYTVTFSAEGYRSETIEVVLTRFAPTTTAGNVTLERSVGDIAGTVVDQNGARVPGALVEISNGEVTRTATTASEPGTQRGTFKIAGLAPGRYTIRVWPPAGEAVTLLRNVAANEVTSVTVTVGSS